MSFCASADRRIGTEHLPAVCDRLQVADKAVLVQYAGDLWRHTMEPPKGTAFLPVRTYHQIKAAALYRGTIPSHFTHVIVDEAHDLTPGALELLDNSTAAVITLGDKFQRLQGRTPSRRLTVRQSELDLTMRSGREIEGVMNPLIDVHPLATNEPPLRATDRVQTVCEFYDRPSIPEKPATLLVGSYWHVFEYYQRLAHEGVKFALLPGTAQGFESFVEGLLNLYFEGRRARNSFLFRYPTWDSLKAESQHIRAFQRIEEMLRKGYQHKDFKASMANIVPISRARYLLGRVDDARNLEFDSVMLTPELLPTSIKHSVGDTLEGILSRLYVGASRAQRRIILPGYMRDWLADQSK